MAACNNSSAPADTTNVPTEQHKHDETAEKKDTTAILAGQKVFFPNLIDGQEIKLPYVVKFGVEGMEVEPAQMPKEPNRGHHHLLVDREPVKAGTMVPMEDPNYHHFGKGQLLDTLSIEKYPMLTPGKHTLTLQFANGLHMSYGPAMSKQIHIVVK